MILLNSQLQLALLRRSKTVHRKFFTAVKRDQALRYGRAEESRIFAGHQFASEKMEPACENHLIVVNNDVSLCGQLNHREWTLGMLSGSIPRMPPIDIFEGSLNDRPLSRE